jgi:hypothetical protein
MICYAQPRLVEEQQIIYGFADALFPFLPKTKSRILVETGHDGIFTIRAFEVRDYYDRHAPLVLRYSKKTDTMDLHAMNIGATKGRTYEVLISTPEPMRNTSIREMATSSLCAHVQSINSNTAHNC